MLVLNGLKRGREDEFPDYYPGDDYGFDRKNIFKEEISMKFECFIEVLEEKNLIRFNEDDRNGFHIYRIVGKYSEVIDEILDRITDDIIMTREKKNLIYIDINEFEEKMKEKAEGKIYIRLDGLRGDERALCKIAIKHIGYKIHSMNLHSLTFFNKEEYKRRKKQQEEEKRKDLEFIRSLP